MEAAEAEAGQQAAASLRATSAQEDSLAAAAALAKLGEDLRASEGARLDAQRALADERVAKEMVQERCASLQQVRRHAVWDVSPSPRRPVVTGSGATPA